MSRRLHPIVDLLLRRLVLGLLTLLAVSILIFSAIEFLPGDLATEMLGQNATPAAVAILRTELGLDRSAPLRYLHWLAGVVQGEFGLSLATGRPIGELIGERVRNTFFLAFYAATMAVPLAVLLGIAAAQYRGSVFDKSISATVLTVVALPEFFIAYILILLFSVQLHWFPSLSNIDPAYSISDKLYHSFLPALCLMLVVLAHIMRMVRASLVGVLGQPYIEMATFKGLGRWRIIVVHALPNAIAPIINVIALNLAYIIVGVVLVETVFVYPGLGQLLVDSVSKRDVTVVQAACLIFAATYILLNIIADIGSIVSNPRLLHPRSS